MVFIDHVLEISINLMIHPQFGVFATEPATRVQLVAIRNINALVVHHQCFLLCVCSHGDKDTHSVPSSARDQGGTAPPTVSPVLGSCCTQRGPAMEPLCATGLAVNPPPLLLPVCSMHRPAEAEAFNKGQTSFPFKLIFCFMRCSC